VLASHVKFLLDFAEAFAEEMDFVFPTEDALGTEFHLCLQLLLRFLAFADLGLEDVVLVAGELRFEMLKIGGELLVASGFASLPLQ
jgi:hypothetical protein